NDVLIFTLTSFKQYFYDNHPYLYEQAPTLAENRPYFGNQAGYSRSYGRTLPSIGDLTEFETPTTFLIDWSYIEHETYGIAEVFFAYEGVKNESGSISLAGTLRDCWNHEGIFSDDYKSS
ncbi:MAG: hypothetical protein GX807_00315, partial [Erysipelotrichia bacterium]|nr:hypothetical protein [Erysipelotrichia bacterium]